MKQGHTIIYSLLKFEIFHLFIAYILLLNMKQGYITKNAICQHTLPWCGGGGGGGGALLTYIAIYSFHSSIRLKEGFW
jgi:hypothetical protein